jgi:hypothetical protein
LEAFMIFKKTVIFLFVLYCFSLGLACAKMVSGSVALPMPPMENQHPPTTPEDKARVAFAELAVQKLLFSAAGKEVSTLTDYGINRSQIHMDFDQACLMDGTCHVKNAEAVKLLEAIKSVYGPVTEMKHAHIIPWSFVNFQNQLQKASKPIPQVTQSGPGITDEVGTDVKGDEPPPMPSPVLAGDEYMIHVYVTFGKRGGDRWHHMDVIVTEDAQGHLKFRRFYIVPMEIPGGNFPEGVVC